MRMHGNPHSTAANNRPAPRRLFVFEAADGAARPGDWPHDHAHERAALANALDEGLMVDEVAQILNGREIVDAFPVRRGESPADYAARAVAEMFVAYLQ
jgi:hypothetical protein